MKNYYRLLKLDPAVAAPVIESRLDGDYDRWRALVTHHDPDVVNEAHAALRLLEEMRTTLLDPGRRDAYDARLAAAGRTVAGLADPEEGLSRMSSPGTAGRAGMDPVPPVVTRERVDAWVCGHCDRANAIGASCCTACGSRIAEACPSCGSMEQLSSPFCSHCGADKVETYQIQQRKAMDDLQAQLDSLVGRIRDGEANYRKIVKTDPDRFKVRYIGWSTGCGTQAFHMLVLVILFFLGREVHVGGIPCWNLLWWGYALGAVILGWIHTKRRVRDHVVQVLRPQVDQLEQQIRTIQQMRYGEDPLEQGWFR